MKFRPTPPLLMLRRLVRSIEHNGIRGAIVHSYQRLTRSLRNHGFKGTFERAFRKAPTAPPTDAVETRPHSFDLLNGTDTGGYISGAKFSAVSLSALFTTAYLGISPAALTQALSALLIQYEEYTFVDLGCGKGRALMVAAQFPFRNLLGVEIATELADIAKTNVSSKPEWAARITILTQDATEVAFPDGPLLVFLYDPFLAPILRRVLANLERQFRRSPRPTYLLYAKNPRFTQIMNSFPFLKEISDSAYPLTREDTALDPFGRTEERFTLYAANLNR
jgi:SAM-dependent methyltransferase